MLTGNPTRVAALLSGLAAYACQGGDGLVVTSPCLVESGRLTRDLTLDGAECRSLRVVDDVIDAGGHTLTIAPGTTLVFDPGVGLIVGEGSPGGLVAVGREDAPIRFVSAPDPNGIGASWRGLVFRGGTLPSSVVAHATFEGAGAIGETTRGCVTVDQVATDALRLADVDLVRCAGPGLVLDAGRVALERITFDNVSIGVRVAPANVADLPRDLDFGPVASNTLLGDVIEVDTVIRATGVPWHVEGDLVVGGPNAPTLTVEPGVRLRFSADRWLAVGLDEPGALETVGLRAEPVELVGGAAGRWHGVVLGPHTTSTSLSHTRLTQGGGEGPNVLGCLSIDVRADAAVRLSDVEISDCERAAIGASETAELAFEVMSGVKIANAPVGLSVRADVLGSIPETTFTDVPYNVAFGGTVREDATWVRQSIPWRVTNDVRVRGDATPTLTLDEGLVLRFSADRWLEVGVTAPGVLVTRGTASNPVMLERADNAPWRGVVLGPRTAAGTRLRHLDLEGAGAAGPNVAGCVSILSAERDRIAIEESLISNCAQAGIAATTAGFEFSGFAANTIVSAPVGLRLPPSAVASVGGDTRYEEVRTNVILGGFVLRSSVWARGALPWTVAGPLMVDGASGPELTLAAGLELRFEADALIAVGVTYGGALVASGATSQRVVFTSADESPTPGAWAGLRFGSFTRSSRLDNVRVVYAGGEGPGHRGGVTLEQTGTRVSITSSTFGSNALGDLYVDCDSAPNLDDNSFGSPDGLVRETNCMN